MKALIILCAGGSLVLSACASIPNGTFPIGSVEGRKERTHLAYQCRNEASQLTRLLPEYRSAGDERRSQMRNAPTPIVRDMQALCWRMSKATEADSAQVAQDCHTA
ncbi:hypothetical protein [Asticcacaulis taihuensis]|jgi:hypothetical protein|uniref:hypothetical protein n=1 Tax=Asticcacaulis taihuensis TaxID=260084 RepID=UPI003F7C835D